MWTLQYVEAPDTSNNSRIPNPQSRKIVRDEPLVLPGKVGECGAQAGVLLICSDAPGEKGREGRHLGQSLDWAPSSPRGIQMIHVPLLMCHAAAHCIMKGNAEQASAEVAATSGRFTAGLWVACFNFNTLGFRGQIKGGSIKIGIRTFGGCVFEQLWGKPGSTTGPA